MKPMKMIAALGFAALIAGCATTDTASRNAPFDTPKAGATPTAQTLDGQSIFEATAPSWNVQRVNVTVPETLVVSEANSYYPSGDIVWRGDPAGDRHAQVKAIFETAMARGTSDMNAGQPVILDVQVLRFHALTEKTRYTIGGIHSISFGVTLRDANSGALLGESRVVKADLRGFGGQQAIDAERAGLTQKVRITDHLAKVIEAELATAGGYTNQRLGLVQAINNTF
ncbi:DUF6778 family protein [Roseobacter sp.]|uniref:DUF6778 family protein n=1 Tax=Roseobacter sp. TaxID=1907202 RepID=UPI0029674D83|nr:DUF6778 family protein [Roseobacter sp.]MDW3184033.1 DUF6778 family protein [Roseobacter sp.]